MLPAKKRREMYLLSDQVKQKWIKDYVERKTAVARKRVDVAETAIEQTQEDLRNAENTGVTPGEPENTLEEVMIATGDSLSNLAGADEEEDGDVEDDEDPELGKLSEDDKPGWWWAQYSKPYSSTVRDFGRRR